MDLAQLVRKGEEAEPRESDYSQFKLVNPAGQNKSALCGGVLILCTQTGPRRHQEKAQFCLYFGASSTQGFRFSSYAARSSSSSTSKQTV